MALIRSPVHVSKLFASEEVVAASLLQALLYRAAKSASTGYLRFPESKALFRSGTLSFIWIDMFQVVLLLDRAQSLKLLSLNGANIHVVVLPCRDLERPYHSYYTP